jgi:hypothetical protein
MEFRLLYDGLLLAGGRGDTRASHKQDIRRIFHKQLKRLWHTNPHLSQRARRRETVKIGDADPVTTYDLDKIADNYRVGGYRCVPLVTTQFELACGLDVLFLRYDQPGKTLIQSGDIDNRIKSLLDALRRPQTVDEACGSPTAEENPFFCLLEDDSLITDLAIRTDLLLDPERDVNDVRLIVTVKIKPISVTLANIDFGF